MGHTHEGVGGTRPFYAVIVGHITLVGGGKYRHMGVVKLGIEL